MKKHQFLIPAIAIASTLLGACSATPAPRGGATAATATGRTKPYPLKTCLVTETGLHSMGSPVSKTYGDQQIKFCCRPCIAKYEENPERYNVKL